MSTGTREVWASGEPYERYVGRWSRGVAREFLAWLDVAPRESWGDVGCGTGALAAGVLAVAAPRTVLAIDRSPGFLAVARRDVSHPRAHFAVADAAALPWAAGTCAATVSGLMLNFVSDAVAALREMARVTRPGGTVAVYVWDYRVGMEMMRVFWDAAIVVDQGAAALDEGERFALCQPEALTTAFEAAGLSEVAVRPVVIPTPFRDFDDYWAPFLGGQGTAPTYLSGLDPKTRERLRLEVQKRLLIAADGSISLTARAWAAQGKVSPAGAP